MVAFLCIVAFSFPEGDWLVLTPYRGNSKALLAMLREEGKSYQADQLGKKFDYEFHKLSDGTTLFYPSTANERERRILQAKLLVQLKGKSGQWTKNKDLPADLQGYVNSEMHSISADHQISLIASVNLSIGSKKKRIYESIPPTNRDLSVQKPDIYENKLADPYAIGNCTFDFGSKQARSIVDQSKTLELAAKYFQELFREIDQGLKDAIAKSFETNDSYSKKMQDLVTMAGRKVKDLPPDLQRFLMDQCFPRDSGISTSDVLDETYTVDSKGYALEVHSGFGGNGVEIFPIKTGT